MSFIRLRKLILVSVSRMDIENKEVRQLSSINPNDALIKKVETLLKDTHIPTNFSRMNSGVGHSISLGRVSDRFHHRMGQGRYDEKFPELKKAIWELGHKIVPFKFASVQVNYNYKTKPHIDKNNVGNSLILGLGNYSGGDLLVEHKPYNIKYKPTIFNGSNLLHSTSPFKGERYSLVFFKPKEVHWSNNEK